MPKPYNWMPKDDSSVTMVITAPEDLANKSVVYVGELYGVVNNSAKSGDLVTLHRCGRWGVQNNVEPMPIPASLTVAVGERLYFNATSRQISKTETDRFLGWCAVDFNNGHELQVILAEFSPLPVTAP